ncbi:hypothetical protein [Hymenobacter jejuensis]|uniref:Uncharacterized protein n=1 Tax=Hymenobacter jejuensis TaxID=2502781 RepID=A0A5B8A537_9BACT|nr:hypothetical protein [Hymenobacter jejuensis]QDA61312.1 hypothetical protein FHG12_14960 [Hymenobacter jejuensis]
MGDEAYDKAIRRIRRLHWLQYLLQAGLTAALVLLAKQRAAASTAVEPQLATWPALLLLTGLLVLVSVLVYIVSKYIKPNIRRPSAENLKMYQSRIFLRNSLLGLISLPPLVSYALTQNPWDLVFFVCLLLVLCTVTVPSARTYQRWLIQ